MNPDATNNKRRGARLRPACCALCLAAAVLLGGCGDGQMLQRNIPVTAPVEKQPEPDRGPDRAPDVYETLAAAFKRPNASNYRDNGSTLRYNVLKGVQMQRSWLEQTCERLGMEMVECETKAGQAMWAGIYDGSVLVQVGMKRTLPYEDDSWAVETSYRHEQNDLIVQLLPDILHPREERIYFAAHRNWVQYDLYLPFDEAAAELLPQLEERLLPLGAVRTDTEEETDLFLWRGESGGEAFLVQLSPDRATRDVTLLRIYMKESALERLDHFAPPQRRFVWTGGGTEFRFDSYRPQQETIAHYQTLLEQWGSEGEVSNRTDQYGIETWQWKGLYQLDGEQYSMTLEVNTSYFYKGTSCVYIVLA